MLSMAVALRVTTSKMSCPSLGAVRLTVGGVVSGTGGPSLVTTTEYMLFPVPVLLPPRTIVPAGKDLLYNSSGLSVVPSNIPVGVKLFNQDGLLVILRSWPTYTVTG